MRRGPLLLAALLAAACGGSPPGPPPPRTGPSTDVAAEARLAMAGGDWRRAKALLQQAIDRTPGSVDLHYRLAVCASHLDLIDEASREFEWVLAHAPADAEEAHTARRWLAETRGTAAARVAAAVAAPPDGAARGSGALSGTVTWVEPGAVAQPRPRQLLMLIGQEGTPTKGARYRVRTNRDGRFEFRDVVPGPYLVTDAIAGRPTWQVRVVVEAGRETVLDLSPANSVAVRDRRASQPTEGH